MRWKYLLTGAWHSVDGGRQEGEGARRVLRPNVNQEKAARRSLLGNTSQYP